MLTLDCTEIIKAIRTAQDEMFVNLYDGFDELDTELNVNRIIEPDE